MKLLFVCLGNICRSPAAEGVFLHLLNQRGLNDLFIVDSAGTGNWHVGHPADRRMTAAAQRRGIHLPSRARQIELNDLEVNKELDAQALKQVVGGGDNAGNFGNTGTKTGGTANNYGTQAGGSGGAGGSSEGWTDGWNSTGSGGSANQNAGGSHGWLSAGGGGSITNSTATGGAGGSLTDIGAVGGTGGAGGSAVGAMGGSVSDQISTSVNIPVTMNL